ncbi:PLP-dependent decarboxylase [Thalassotalea sp. G2M2-11]|uniref:PLP-dependent decarboxylase n=1 Tax=Thalassotalea sp. G2M2-11 TaxID=2787627 RepID=UPI0019D110F8|nr:PLP-dependent decarboxylase [Thalassotalea sp. G2M2-11]
MANHPQWLSPAISAELQQQVLESKTLDVANGCFVYDLEQLQAHLASLQQQDVIKLWFAVKANPLSRVIQTLDSAGFNFDVASSGELAQVLQQGIAPERILNTGPAKSKQQIHAFIKQGVRVFVAESLNQLQWLNEASQAENVTPQVLLRVQLQWPEGEKNPLGGNALTPFGLSVAEWQGIKVTDFPSVDICGLHIFQWGNMLSNQKMYQLWQQMVPPLCQLANDIGMTLKILDLGGGLGIDYLQQGVGLSWQQIITDLAKIKQQAGVDELWLELGRFAVAHCGYYLSPVVDKKMNYQQAQLVLAGGINHLLRPAITDQPFPVALLRTSQSESKQYDVHGPLCTSMDKLGQFSLPEDVSVDDVLVFGLCGAYGFTESMPFFLCHEIASEWVWHSGKLTEIRTAESANWYLR